jgi:hypothetical protein
LKPDGNKERSDEELEEIAPGRRGQGFGERVEPGPVHGRLSLTSSRDHADSDTRGGALTRIPSLRT